jgi:prepilin-type N-terminal cleavage/methylation domain-containing protein
MKFSRGFTLVEVLVALSLLTIFFALAGVVFNSTISLSSGSAELCNRTSQIDSAVSEFRRDVWNSSHLTADEQKSVELEFSDGGRISWAIDPLQGVTRSDSRGDKMRWSGVGEKWLLSVDGPCLSIRDGADELRLPSQILLSQGVER